MCGKMKYEGVYMLDNSERIFKIHSLYNCKNVISSNMVGQYYKYSSNLEFEELVGTKKFHNLTDAIILKTSKWGGLRSQAFSPPSQKSMLNIIPYKT